MLLVTVLLDDSTFAMTVLLVTVLMVTILLDDSTFGGQYFCKIRAKSTVIAKVLSNYGHSENLDFPTGIRILLLNSPVVYDICY